MVRSKELLLFLYKLFFTINYFFNLEGKLPKQPSQTKANN